jgi:hypothetical protein
MGIYEQISDVSKDLSDLKPFLAKEHAIELEAAIVKLQAALHLFNNNEVLPAVIGELEVFSTRTSVERLGIGKEVVEMAARKKLKPPEISHILEQRGFAVTAAAVKIFLDKYQKLTYAEKVKIKSDSVFNTSNQLEKLLTIINAQLGRLQYSTDAKQQEVHSKYVSELRQTLKLAADLQLKIGELAARQKFEEAVKEIIFGICSPEQQKEVLQSLKDFGNPDVLATQALRTFAATNNDYLHPDLLESEFSET